MGTKIDAGFSNLLNLCRWMAAFLVVISHVRTLIFPLSGAFDLGDPVSTLFYFGTGFGHEAVIVFFVLSGYLVGGKAISDFRAGRFSPPDYFIARFSRIYTVLLPALALGLALDLTGSRLLFASGFYTHPPSLNSLNFSIVEQLDATTFIGNLLMLQTILVDPLGSNAPLWSLANEWWYYVIFGLVLCALKGQRLPLCLLVSVLAAVGTAALFPRQISLWFLIWLAGAALANLELRKKLPMVVGLSAFILIFAVMRIPWVRQLASPSDFLNDAVVALGFLLFLASAREAKRLPVMGIAINARLADFSYSIYLFHFPCLVFLGSLAAVEFHLELPGQIGLSGSLWFGAIVVLLYLLAFGMSRLTEAKTPIVRANLTILYRRMSARLLGCAPTQKAPERPEDFARVAEEKSQTAQPGQRVER